MYDIIKKSFYDFMLNKYSINSMVNIIIVFKIVSLWDRMKEYIMSNDDFPTDPLDIENFWSRKTRGKFDRIQNGELVPKLVNGLLTAENYKLYLEEKNSDPFDIQFVSNIPDFKEKILYCYCDNCIEEYLYYDQMSLINDY